MKQITGTTQSLRKEGPLRTSLVVQGLGLCLPLQGVQVRSLVRELRNHMPSSQKTKTQNRSYIATNSTKTLKMVHIKQTNKPWRNRRTHYDRGGWGEGTLRDGPLRFCPLCPTCQPGLPSPALQLPLAYEGRNQSSFPPGNSVQASQSLRTLFLLSVPSHGLLEALILIMRV